MHNSLFHIVFNQQKHAFPLVQLLLSRGPPMVMRLQLDGVMKG